MHLQFMFIAELFYEVIRAYVCPSVDWMINVKVAHTMEYSSGEKRKRKSYNLQKHEAGGVCIKQSKPGIQCVGSENGWNFSAK